MATHASDYLIIGNSAAGVTAAEYIRETDGEGTITIVGREPYPVYGRPLISYLIEGKTSEDRLGFKPADFYETHQIETLLGPDFEAVELRPEDHTVRLANEDVIAYGKCLVATGSDPFIPPIEGLSDAENVYRFITLDDAKAAWNEASEATGKARKEGRASRVLVIGAGLIGLKAAEALSWHVDDVVVLELAPHILPAVLDFEGAAILQGELAGNGIDCRPGVTAERLLLENGRVCGAVLTDGEELSCDFAIAAVGVRPNSALAVEAGATQGRGLLVDNRLRTNLPDVYAAGDVVQVTDLLDGSKRPLALWPNAMRQGKIAGLQMAGASEAEEFPGNFPVNAVDFFDISLLTAGVINPLPELGCTEQVVVEGCQYAKFVTKDDRLLGYILLNRPANAGIYTALIEEKVPLSSLDQAIFQAAPLNMEFSPEKRWERLHRFYPADRNRLGQKERG